MRSNALSWALSLVLEYSCSYGYDFFWWLHSYLGFLWFMMSKHISVTNKLVVIVCFHNTRFLIHGYIFADILSYHSCWHLRLIYGLSTTLHFLRSLFVAQANPSTSGLTKTLPFHHSRLLVFFCIRCSWSNMLSLLHFLSTIISLWPPLCSVDVLLLKHRFRLCRLTPPKVFFQFLQQLIRLIAARLQICYGSI